MTDTPDAVNTEKAPAKKAAAKKTADAPKPERQRPTEVLKYAYTTDEQGNVTSLAACGSTDALFEYVKSNPGRAYQFIDGPKGTDIIEAINAS